jgi:molybdenum cofactor biosynthesis enzyme MoaA
MCNIWKIPGSVQDIPAEDWLSLVGPPVFSHLKELDITGGEPFLKEDLPALLQGICLLKDSRLRDLRSVAITTNGFLTEKVVSVTRRAGRDMEDAGMSLSLFSRWTP